MNHYTTTVFTADVADPNGLLAEVAFVATQADHPTSTVTGTGHGVPLLSIVRSRGRIRPSARLVLL